MASTAGPSTSSNGPAPFHGGGKGRYAQNQAKYGQPLPLILPSSSDAGPSTPSSGSYLSSLIPSFGDRRPTYEQISRKQCIGTLDPLTRSVWVTTREDVEFLFQKGFFGKGTLSRSDPTWRARRIDMVKGGSTAKAEQIRAKRREERKQFKVDRAAAMLDAAKAAEALIAAARDGTQVEGQEQEAVRDSKVGKAVPAEDDIEREDVASPAPSTLSLPASSAADIDISTLTPQTFLVRPTRPDANRNRGKNAFRRKPKPKPPVGAGQGEGVGETTGGQAAATADPATPATQSTPVQSQSAEAEDDGSDEDPFDEDIVQEMEHLQLALEEAWFLGTALGVLKIYDPISESYIPPSALLLHLLTPTPLPSPSPFLSPSPSSFAPTYPLLPDDPFLVSYVSYHHFRSLGWVVKPGIKFSCDWLLYRKGPVFSHSAFACVVVPVYEDQEEKKKSVHGQTDWYEERASWKWVNTVMRVNSLVQKTVIMVYVTIPALSSFPSSYKTKDGSLNLDKSDMRFLLPRYTVRECALTRFGPARRRD